MHHTIIVICVDGFSFKGFEADSSAYLHKSGSRSKTQIF